MAITVLGKGTASDITGASALTITNVAPGSGNCLVVVYSVTPDQQISYTAVVKWGTTVVPLVFNTTDGGDNNVYVHVLPNTASGTHDVTITWVTPPTLKIGLVTVLTGLISNPYIVSDDQISTGVQNNPNMVVPANTNNSIDYMILLTYFGAPSTDAAATWSNGFTLGPQKVGTNVGDNTDRTLQDSYKVPLTANETATSTIPHARHWDISYHRFQGPGDNSLLPGVRITGATTYDFEQSGRGKGFIKESVDENINNLEEENRPRGDSRFGEGMSQPERNPETDSRYIFGRVRKI